MISLYYNSKEISVISSATSIREAINSNIDISNSVPKETLSKINNNLVLDNYYDLIKYKILSTNDLTYILGIDEKIEPRIKKSINVSLIMFSFFISSSILSKSSWNCK